MSIALYQTIYNELKRDIEEGRYEGLRLPTEKEISERYYVSRITAKNALNALSREGIIVRIPGKGSYLKSKFPAVAECGAPRDFHRVLLLTSSFSAAYGLELIQGAVEQGEREGIDITVKKNFNSQANESRMLEEARAARYDGVILQPTNGEIYSRTIIDMVSRSYPIVMVDRYLNGMDVPFVGIDNEKYSFEIVSRMIREGHRNIMVLVTLNGDSYTQQLRVNGYVNAHIAMGVMLRQELILRGLDEERIAAGLSGSDKASFEPLVKTIENALIVHPEVTAVFSTEYRLSQAVLAAAERAGRKDTLRIVGFDAVSDLLGSRVDHIKQPQYEIGVKAVELVHRLIHGQPIEKREWLLEAGFVSAE